MSIEFTVLARNAMLDGLGTFIDLGPSGTHRINIYQSNIQLCTFVIGTDPPFLAATNAASPMNALQVQNTTVVSAAVTGNANRMTLLNANQIEALACTISTIGGGGDIEVPTVRVTTGSSQFLNSFTLRITPEGQFFIRASFAFA